MAQKTIRYRVARSSGPTVGGRVQGRKLLEAVFSELIAAPDGIVLEIGFDGVRLMDFSAADEFLTNLLRRVRSGELGTRRIVLSNLSAELREAFQAVLQLRSMHCLDVRSGGRTSVLGQLSSPLAETLSLVNDKGLVSVREAADAARIRLSTATNRLNSLVNAGLVRRLHDSHNPQGRQFLYESLVPRPSRPAQGRHKSRLRRGRGKG